MTQTPRISVVIASYNAGRTIEGTIGSVLAQTVRELEVVVADDASGDDSRDRVAALAAGDRRVKLLAVPVNGGPAAARNAALDASAGDWVAVVDSDDLLHPARFERLLHAAEASRADLVADDMLVFDDAGQEAPRPMLGLAAPCTVGLPEYVRSNALNGSAPALGYLKPMVRRAALDGLRYDPALRIAEDYDLVAKLLLRGARFQLVPGPTYFYRRHATSISHRLSEAALQAMLDADDRFRAGLAEMPGLLDALDARRRSIVQAAAFEGLVAALKRRDWKAAASAVAREPRGALLLRQPLEARLRRPGKASGAAPPPARPGGPDARWGSLCAACDAYLATA